MGAVHGAGAGGGGDVAAYAVQQVLQVPLLELAGGLLLGVAEGRLEVRLSVSEAGAAGVAGISGRRSSLDTLREAARYF